MFPPTAGPGLPEACLLLGLRWLRPAGPRRAEGRDGAPPSEAVRLSRARGVPDLRRLHLLLRRQRSGSVTPLPGSLEEGVGAFEGLQREWALRSHCPEPRLGVLISSAVCSVLCEQTPRGCHWC